MQVEDAPLVVREGPATAHPTDVKRDAACVPVRAGLYESGNLALDTRTWRGHPLLSCVRIRSNTRRFVFINLSSSSTQSKVVNAMPECAGATSAGSLQRFVKTILEAGQPASSANLASFSDAQSTPQPLSERALISWESGKHLTAYLGSMRGNAILQASSSLSAAPRSTTYMGPAKSAPAFCTTVAQ